MALSDKASAMRLPAALAMARASSPFFRAAGISPAPSRVSLSDGSQPFTEQKAAAQRPGGFMSGGPMFKGALMLSQSRQRPCHERIAGVTKHGVAALLRNRKRRLGGSHGLMVFAGDEADHGKGRVRHGFSVLIAACLGYFQDLVEFSGSGGVIAKQDSGTPRYKQANNSSWRFCVASRRGTVLVQ